MPVDCRIGGPICMPVVDDVHLDADELVQILDEHKDEIEKEVCHMSLF